MNSQNMIVIDDTLAMKIACQVVAQRRTVPEAVAKTIDFRCKKNIADKLVGSKIPEDKLPQLIEKVREMYYFSLMQPGESVGIACAQAIGECVTQSALNTFHKAGLDTGVNSVMKSIEDIIDVPRAKTSRRPHIITAYHETLDGKSLYELFDATRHHVTEISVSDAVQGREVVKELPETAKRWAAAAGVSQSKAPYYIAVRIDLQVMFTYRVDLNILRTCMGFEAIVPPFSSAVQREDGEWEYTVYVPITSDSVVPTMMAELGRRRLTGVPHVVRHGYQKDSEDRWHVVLEGAPIAEVLKATDGVYDTARITTSRVSDICDIWGVYAARTALQHMGAEILGDSVSRADMALLATKITFSGKPMPCSRFTMRNNPSPLAKISFEECQGGCRAAAIYREREAFKTLSSMVIAGKLPPIGSAMSRCVVDTEKYLC